MTSLHQAESARLDPAAQGLAPEEYALLDREGGLRDLLDAPPDWDRLRRLAITMTGGDFSKLFEKRTPTRSAGPFRARCLEGAVHDRHTVIVRDLCDRFITGHLGTVLASKVGGSVMRDRLSALVTELSLAVCPDDMSIPAKALHAQMSVWMHVVNEGLEALATLATGGWGPVLGAAQWYPTYAASLRTYYLACWDAGLQRQPLPAPPTFQQMIQDAELSAFTRLATQALRTAAARKADSLCGMGDALHACGTRLLGSSPYPGRIMDQTRRITQELNRCIDAMLDRERSAAVDRRSYLERHGRRGKVRVCVELNLLLYAWQKKTSASALYRGDPDLFAAVLQGAELVALLCDELYFAGSIGRPEESLMAVEIADRMLERGARLRSGSVHTAAGHGRILQEHAHTPDAFDAATRVVELLRARAVRLIAELAALSVRADVEDARCGAAVVLGWAIGYPFFSPVSTHRGPSFPLLRSVLESDREHYSSEARKARQASKGPAPPGR